ncbi:MAG: protease [Candidatus Aminicenantes bacterium RBG_16_63_16]|nr:MAG: protease [Candidatus Aminicenantes bacterium RBG_16_63_16]
MTSFKRSGFLFIVLLLALAAPSLPAPEARVLRFPAIHGDQIVFSYAGDLYTVAAAGGIGRKLTTHQGYEAFARFSPDGRSIAFTAEYDGNREVYVIPAEGGVPKRLTYTASLGRDDISDRMGPNNIVMGWTNEGKSVVFRSRMREWNDFNGQLYLVPAGGGTPVQLPLPRGGFCSFSPDDKKLAHNRVFREFRTWKRYRGGMADDIWVYDFETKKTENITNNPALDIIPMWSGNKIYFVSDRDEMKKMNLYSYDLASRQTARLTDFREFDIKFPSLGAGAIVFENGGHIYRFDLTSARPVRVPVAIADDLVSGRTRLAKVGDRVMNYEISPDGRRALFGARGEVFTVPAKYGNTRNLTNTAGVHERDAKWSPDARWIACISDKTGEDEIWIMPQDGRGPARQVTSGADTYKYQIYWSPDSRKILWSDKLLRLNYVDIEKSETVVVSRAETGEIRDYVWSPDSRWVAFARPEAEGMPKVYLYSLETKASHEVTDGWYNSSDPSFSADGKYLFFVSDRDFNPVFSRVEYNYTYLAMAKIYLVTLAADVRSPFEPKSDEVEIKKEPEKPQPGAAVPEKKEAVKEPAAKPAEPAKVVTVKVDPERLKSRIVGLPVAVADYRNIQSVGDRIYYLSTGGDRQTALKMYDLAEKKETDLGPVNGYEISADQKKMIVGKEGSYAIIDLPKTPVKIEDKLDLSQMEMTIDRRAEWNEIYEECWRQMKYFFYVPNMGGVDWEAMRLRYKPLADAVNHRADLTYVIGELIGELGTGHTYVGGGDMPVPPKIKLGLLGARLEREPKSGYYAADKIYRGQNWTRSLRSPLTEIGVNVKEGEYILGVDGVSTSAMTDIYAALYGKAGKQVTLKVGPRPEEKGSRDVVVVPVETENELIYHTWVEENIEKVNQATGGRVGYIHIPDMGMPGLNEFVKYYYPQLRKKALIVDVRGNGGGSVSPQIVERLRREIAFMEMARNTQPFPDPGGTVVGPKVCLINEFSASDGDIFPYRFKKYGLGKVIGKRTWGGVVGIRGTLPIVDGGFLNKPEFAPFSAEGKGWIMEGVGVEPDIVVDNDPGQEFAGIDQQLNKGIEVILEELKTQEVKLPPIPPLPKK